MDVIKAINSRKSIRKYKDKPIPDEVITELLEAARLAPSAKNTQSHKYIIVTDKENREKITKQHKIFKRDFFEKAPLVIICCADPSLYPESSDVDLQPIDYAKIDLSIAASFLVLRAVELGLGSVFIAWIYRDKIKQIFNLPDNYIVPFVIALGYPAENPAPKPRKSLGEIILFKKIILVDAINAFVLKNEGIFKEMHQLLEQYPNRKIILTGANDEEMEKFGLNNMPYEVFTLKHNPNKTDPEYFKIMLKHYNLNAADVIYFEHNPDAVENARSVGIKTFYYDKDKKDLAALKNFIDENCH